MEEPPAGCIGLREVVRRVPYDLVGRIDHGLVKVSRACGYFSDLNAKNVSIGYAQAYGGHDHLVRQIVKEALDVGVQHVLVTLPECHPQACRCLAPSLRSLLRDVLVDVAQAAYLIPSFVSSSDGFCTITEAPRKVWAVIADLFPFGLTIFKMQVVVSDTAARAPMRGCDIASKKVSAIAPLASASFPDWGQRGNGTRLESPLYPGQARFQHFCGFAARDTGRALGSAY